MPPYGLIIVIASLPVFFFVGLIFTLWQQFFWNLLVANLEIIAKKLEKITKLLKPQNGKKKTPVGLIPVKPTAKGFIKCKERFAPICPVTSSRYVSWGQNQKHYKAV